MSTTPQWNDMVLVGRIARAHGLRGQVIVSPETDFVEERFRAGAGLWTQSQQRTEHLTIASARIQNGRPVIGFEGFSSIGDVERLVGQDLRIPESEIQPLEEGSYYHHQLVGCEVATVGGERVGEVVRVEGGAAGSVLVVLGARGEVLVPLATAVCVNVDITNRRIRIDPPAGLLELNEDSRTRTRKRPERPERVRTIRRPE